MNECTSDVVPPGATMEIFIDFGLFELLAAAGLAVVSRTIYSRKLIGPMFLAVSVIAPVVALVSPDRGLERTFALISVVFGAVNASVVAAVLQTGDLPRLRLSRPKWLVRSETWNKQ